MKGLKLRDDSGELLTTVSVAVHKASEVFALDCLPFAVLASLTCPAIVMNTPRLHYSQVFCKYGAPAITRPGLQGIALKYS